MRVARRQTPSSSGSDSGPSSRRLATSSDLVRSPRGLPRDLRCVELAQEAQQRAETEAKERKRRRELERTAAAYAGKVGAWERRLAGVSASRRAAVASKVQADEERAARWLADKKEAEAEKGRVWAARRAAAARRVARGRELVEEEIEEQRQARCGQRDGWWCG